LVLEAFRGYRPKGTEGCHEDDDVNNNNLDNLRWDTPKNNKIDAKRNGGIKMGSERRNAKLVESDIPRIRELRFSGIPVTRIAAEFGVTIGTIYYALSERGWAHVP
jgi:hypothetical protein